MSALVPFTSTGLTGLKALSGWGFTETSGSGSVTVVLREDSNAGAIILQITVPQGTSVGDDWGDPAGGYSDIHATVTGTGTLQGALRGRKN